MTRAASLVLALACAGAAATASLAQQDAAPRRTASGDINAGRMVVLGGLYGGQRIACIQCHGLDGAGNSSGAFPRLSGQSAWYLYKTLQDYAAGLRLNPIMSPIAQTLNDRQMQDVAAYYAAAKAPAIASPGRADVSVLQIGGAIAASGVAAQGVPACNGCHGADGRGAPPIYPVLAGQYAAYTRYQLALWKSGRRGGDPMDIMELIAKAMTEEQIDAVARYYAAVTPQTASQATARAPGKQSPAAHARPDAISRNETEGILGLPMRPNRQPPYLGGAPASRAARTDTGNEGRE